MIPRLGSNDGHPPAASRGSVDGAPEGVLAVRAGHGANCSSVGSVVDLLFAASVGGGALLVAIAAAFEERERASVGAEGAAPPDGADGGGPASSDVEDPDAGAR